MKRIFTVMAVAALMAALLVFMAVPAFADKDVNYQGHQTSDLSGDCTTGCTLDFTSSGKEGNVESGPGHTKDTSFRDDSAIGTPDTFVSQDSTSSGHTEGGGGKRDTTLIVPGDDTPVTRETNCVGSDDGSGAPGC